MEEVFNQCEKKTDTSDLKIDLDRKVDGAETKVVRYESKDGKVVTELWEVVDGGHVTPPRSAARERIIKWMQPVQVTPKPAALGQAATKIANRAHATSLG